jgi:methionyl-tRNA formyltransferase
MKKTQVVLFTSEGLTGNFTLSFLKKNYTVIGVVLDKHIPGSRLNLVKKRIKKLGLMKVLLQLLFMKGLVPLLTYESRKRREEIIKGHDQNSIKNHPNVFKPKSINDPQVINFVNNLNPDVVIVSGTGIINKNIIENLKMYLINIHVGITPKYRGVHGGYWALVNNDHENCGVTVHLIDNGIDTGGVICQKLIIPSSKDNYATYPLLQMSKGFECIKEAILEIEQNRLTIKENNLESKLYYHPTVTEYLYHRIINKIK